VYCGSMGELSGLVCGVKENCLVIGRIGCLSMDNLEVPTDELDRQTAHI